MLKASGIHSLIASQYDLACLASRNDPSRLVERNYSTNLEKGSPKECRNYRGTTLLSIAGKVFTTILLNNDRIQLLGEHRKEQSGFTLDNSTVYHIVTLNANNNQTN